MDNPYFILEDTNAEPTDRCILNSSEQLFTYGKEVSYFIKYNEHTPEDIIGKMRNVSSWVFNGFLTSLPPSVEIENRQVVTSQAIQVLAQNTKHVLVGAFDHEAYLIWSKR